MAGYGWPSPATASGADDLQGTTLGSTQLQVSLLGLGTVELGMPYGLGQVTPPADDDCIRLLHHAVDHGICYIDTAAAYGRSEELIGRAFAGRRRPVIATKVALRDPDGTPWHGRRIVTGIEASIERSLRLLGTDALDLVQIHNDDAVVAGDPALREAMDTHLQSGEVRNWGASTYGRSAPLTVIDYGEPIRTLQVAYSVLDRRLEEDVFPACQRAGVGRVLRSVFLQGVLSERRHSLPEDLLPLRQAADAVARVADGLALPLAQVAMRFALFEAGAQVTLVGTADAAELEANIGAAQDGPLPPDAVAALRSIQVADERLLNPANWPRF